MRRGMGGQRRRKEKDSTEEEGAFGWQCLSNLSTHRITRDIGCASNSNLVALDVAVIPPS